MGKSYPDLLSFVDQLIARKYADDSGKLVEFIQRDKKGQSKTMSRDLITNGFQSRLFKFDLSGPPLFPFFENTKGLSKICDYILFAQHKDLLYIVFFELKDGIDSAKDQIEASLEFVRFLLNSAKRVKISLLDFDSEHVIIRKVRVSESRSAHKYRKTDPASYLIDRVENGLIDYLHPKTVFLKQIIDFEP